MPENKTDQCIECKKKSRWREDFPVEWESDNYITRREMVKFLALGSLTIAGANFLLAALPHLSKAAEMPRKKLALASSIPVGGSMLFSYPTDKDPCILVRQNNGDLAAYSQVCTHLSCAVIHRANENALFCPCHQGYFTVAEGRPFAGPPTRPLPRIKIDLHADEIFAVGVEV
ncbi:MAG TPA: Rieske 2Fe-2S domain-containing protein [Terriglobales bacterium]|jgi:arsenite oxidase small subunit|nr:Rieske 2Fe-2S domain-containing protein [Terriglobales bacterium]